MLNLYEACYHSFDDESILDDAKDLATKYLKENQEKIDDERISSLVRHALELPLHWSTKARSRVVYQRIREKK